jgi:hypothetical protein
MEWCSVPNLGEATFGISPNQDALEYSNVCRKTENDLSFKLGSGGVEEGLGKQPEYQSNGINYEVGMTFDLLVTSNRERR